DDMYGGRIVTAEDLAAADPALDASRLAAALAERFPGFAPEAPLMARQALHAATLAFTHPISGRPMQFTAPLPADMRRLGAALRLIEPQATLVTPPGATADLPTLLGE